MEIIKKSDTHEACQIIIDTITEKLKKDLRVLWLISGGSNIVLEIEILNRILEKTSKKELENLTVSLADERYGVKNHIDSNWKQLQDKGFPVYSIKTITVLENKALKETVEEFETALEEATKNSDFIIAQLGLGADAHIAGILPNSPALSSQRSICGYESSPFSRITITPYFIKKIDKIFIFAFGESKRQVLKEIKSIQKITPEKPVSILIDSQKTVLFTDQNQ